MYSHCLMTPSASCLPPIFLSSRANTESIALTSICLTRMVNMEYEIRISGLTIWLTADGFCMAFSYRISYGIAALIVYFLMGGGHWYAVANTNQNSTGQKKVKEVNLTTVYFPTDRGRWTDRIVSAFESELMSSKVAFNFHRVAWVYKENNEQLVDLVAMSKPDMVFLPNDDMYKFFAEEINRRTGASIIFVAFHSPLHRLNRLPERKQAGAFHYHPLAGSLNEARKIFKLDRIGIVKGPCSSTVISEIKEVVPELIAEEFSTVSYKEYADKLLDFAKKYDAVWAMAPFGVVDESTGEWVLESKLQIALDNLPKPSIGWGAVRDIRRTIEFSISPEALGKSAAVATIAVIREDKFFVNELKTHDIKMYAPHLKKFGKEISGEVRGKVQVTAFIHY